MHPSDPRKQPAAVRTNRLVHATSPYLLQHAHNPVDWYEWGPEASEKARREDKPIFLSIGYSACHWCHVMAHESFEDAEVAAVMNTHFVNVKVDREERPDLDDIYMQATMIVSQGGGWPMSVWLTPDGKPFFAGTYFPPRAKWGRPGFLELCERIGELWNTRRAGILEDAGRLSELVQRSLATGGQEVGITLGVIDKVVDVLAGAFDSARGGILSGGSNKFPPSLALDLFLRSAHRNGRQTERSRQLIELVETTLDHMAAGGIYDQLGGGIHRYSTDADWHVPHFEKMLYDQALVSRAYVDAWLATGKPLYRRVAREIFDYVLADLQSPAGGFYSTRDADSEGEEGKYFVWTQAEIVDVLGPESGALVCQYYDVSERGNWSDPHAAGVPKNVLRVLRDVDAVARQAQVEPAALEAAIQAARPKLLAARSRRTPPQRDDKILCEWNGLMISSLARGGASLDEPRYVEAAAQSADFVLTRQWMGAGCDARFARGRRSRPRS